MYRLTDVTKLYAKGRQTVPAVRDLTLVIEDGEWLAVQGRTGHGKSTLLNLLGGLDRPTSGTIELDGRNLSRLREDHRRHDRGRGDRGGHRDGHRVRDGRREAPGGAAACGHHLLAGRARDRG